MLYFNSKKRKIQRFLCVPQALFTLVPPVIFVPSDSTGVIAGKRQYCTQPAPWKDHYYCNFFYGQEWEGFVSPAPHGLACHPYPRCSSDFVLAPRGGTRAGPYRHHYAGNAEGLLRGTIVNTPEQNQILLVKIGTYVGFCVYRRSHLLGSPEVLHTACLRRTSSQRAVSPLHTSPSKPSCTGDSSFILPQLVEIFQGKQLPDPYDLRQYTSQLSVVCCLVGSRVFCTHDLGAFFVRWIRAVTHRQIHSTSHKVYLFKSR